VLAVKAQTPPGKHIATAYPTCPKCGDPLTIDMFGEFDPDSVGQDLTQIHFQRGRHTCRPKSAKPRTRQ